MFRFDDILERWAMEFAPISHRPEKNEKHFTFFRISMIDQNSEFIRNFGSTPSPAMAYVTHIDGEIAKQNPKAATYRHVIYFMVKQAVGTLSKTTATSEGAVADARFYADELTQDLLAYLRVIKGVANGNSLTEEQQQVLGEDMVKTIQGYAADKVIREGLRGLQLDSAHWGTLPVYLNGWQMCGLTIEQILPRETCLKPNKYLNSHN